MSIIYQDFGGSETDFSINVTSVERFSLNSVDGAEFYEVGGRAVLDLPGF